MNVHYYRLITYRLMFVRNLRFMIVYDIYFQIIIMLQDGEEP